MPKAREGSDAVPRDVSDRIISDTTLSLDLRVVTWVAREGTPETRWQTVKLSEYFGVARESLWRTLTKLELAGIVSIRTEGRQQAFVSLGNGCTNATSLNESFDQFWSVYPRREAKVEARKAWGQVRADRHLVAILSDVGSREWSPHRQFNPLPATYLRGRRWEDERPAKGLNGAKVLSLVSDDDVAAAALQLGLTANPGESYDQLRGRVRSTMEVGR